MQIIVGVLVRWILTLAAGWLVKHGATVDPTSWEHAISQVTAHVIAFGTVAWSIWIKRHPIAAQVSAARDAATPHGGLGGGMAALLFLGACLLSSGCASVGITPCTSISYAHAEQLAAREMVKVPTADGLRWLPRARVAALGDPLNADANTMLKIDAGRRILAESEGLTDYQIGQQYNADGIVWGKVGDWSIGTVLAGLASWGVTAIANNNGGDKSTKATTATPAAAAAPAVSNHTTGAPIVTVNSSGGTVGVTVNTGQAGNAGGGTGGQTSPVVDNSTTTPPAGP